MGNQMGVTGLSPIFGSIKTSVFLMNVIEPVDQFKVVAGWNGINLRFPIEVRSSVRVSLF